MSECTCQPGVEADGWREVRCEECILVELAEWGRVLAWLRNLREFGTSRFAATYTPVDPEEDE